jgi:hypothetical protein
MALSAPFALRQPDRVELFAHRATENQQFIPVTRLHMLSHLVGSANRADIRKLKLLERERAALTEKIERQYTRLRQTIDERNSAVEKLNTLLIDRSRSSRNDLAEGRDEELTALRELVATQQAQLELTKQRCIAGDRKAVELRESIEASHKALSSAQAECATLANELHALETMYRVCEPASTSFDLKGTVLLYVGGHAQTLPAMRQVVEERGGVLLHHDGGLEDRSGMLAGLVSRAAVAIFPVDCVSHEASLGLKRLCRQHGRPFIPLRSAGLSSFVATLGRVCEERVFVDGAQMEQTSSAV